MRILLIEDDAVLGEGLAATLSLEGHRVDWLDDGREAARAFDADTFDAVVLDLALPGLDGEQILRAWREAGIAVPVLILTAHAESRDCVAILNAGADDYVVKPARTSEIEARLRALVRRRAGRAEETLAFGALDMNIARRAVWADGRGVDLSAYEFVVLQSLMEHGGHPVTREHLQTLLYGWSDGPESNSLEVLIHRLRQKLGRSAIMTVRNVGYRLTP